MKTIERDKARKLRIQGHSLQEITKVLGVAKSSVSVWVRDIELSEKQKQHLASKGFYRKAVELRRQSRLESERQKRELVIQAAQKSIGSISSRQLWLMGTMLYWAEGGKTQRMVRFSNGDPEMIKTMMVFFRRICQVPESKFHGYIHIHPHLNYKKAEKYWSLVSGIPLNQFYKTYRKPNISSQNKKNSLPFGTFDIYIMDTILFLKITGWARGIFANTRRIGLKNRDNSDTITGLG